MTLLMREQEIRDEAEARGIEKGRAAGRMEMVMEMLRENMDISFIAAISKLLEEEILQLKKRSGIE